MPSMKYGSGQVTEVGAAEAMGGGWETQPGSAIAYGGQEDENSAPDSWGDAIGHPGEIEQLQAPGRGPIEQWQEELAISIPQGINGGPTPTAGEAEVCPLTPMEWEAHKAQMAADAAEAKRAKMIHMAMAAGAGYVLARLMK